VLAVAAVRWSLDELVALVPAYDERGFGTQVWLADGTQQMVGRRPRRVMEQALRRLGMTFASYMARYEDSYYGPQYAPIVCAGRAFMTCQLSRPRTSGDDAYGYVRIDAVDDIGIRDRVGVIRLVDGRELLSVQAALTVAHHRDRAVAEFYREERARARVQAASLQQIWAYAADNAVRNATDEAQAASLTACLTSRAAHHDAVMFESPPVPGGYLPALGAVYAKAHTDELRRRSVAQILMQVSRDLLADE